MNITPSEAEEALASIQKIMKKTRHSISSSGAYKFLILWGVTWLIGFLNSQFLPGDLAGNIWIGLDIIAGFISAFIGIRLNRGIRSSSPSTTGKRIGLFWLILFLYCFLFILIANPIDGKQLAMYIILVVTLGWIAMGLLLSFVSVWWGLALVALACLGYFFLPGIFFLLMAILGGGGMIVLGFYIRDRW